MTVAPADTESRRIMRVQNIRGLCTRGVKDQKRSMRVTVTISTSVGVIVRRRSRKEIVKMVENVIVCEGERTKGG